MYDSLLEGKKQKMAIFQTAGMKSDVKRILSFGKNLLVA